MPPNGFSLVHVSFLIQVLHVGVIGQDIVVWFQLEFYPLGTAMETEREVEVGKMVDMVRRRLDHRMEHGGDMFDGFGGLRSGCGENRLTIRTNVTRRSIKRTPTFNVTHEQRWDHTCNQGQDLPKQLHRRTNLLRKTRGRVYGETKGEKEKEKEKDRRIRQPYNISRILNCKQSDRSWYWKC